MANLNPRVLGIFLAGYIGAVIILGVLTFFGVNITGGGVMATTAAATKAGQSFGKWQGRKPTSQESWLYALVFTLIVIVLTVIEVLTLADQGTLHLIITDARAITTLGILFAIGFFACRLAFPFGARHAASAYEKT